jgi:hypothetical protein
MWGIELFGVTRYSDWACCCELCRIFWLCRTRHTKVGKVVVFVWGDAIVKLRESEVKLSRSSRLPAGHVGQRSPASRWALRSPPDGSRSRLDANLQRFIRI